MTSPNERALWAGPILNLERGATAAVGQGLIQASIFYDKVESLDRTEHYDFAGARLFGPDGGERSSGHVVEELRAAGVIEEVWMADNSRGLDGAMGRLVDWIHANEARLRERRDGQMRFDEESMTAIISGDKLARPRMNLLMEALRATGAEGVLPPPDARLGYTTYIRTDILVCRRLAYEVGILMTGDKSRDLITPNISDIVQLSRGDKADTDDTHSVASLLIPEILPSVENLTADQVLSIRSHRKVLVAFRQRLWEAATAIQKDQGAVERGDVKAVATEILAEAEEIYSEFTEYGLRASVSIGATTVLENLHSSINEGQVPSSRGDIYQMVLQAFVALPGTAGRSAWRGISAKRRYRRSGLALMFELEKLSGASA